jgi:hypothetical protein
VSSTKHTPGPWVVAAPPGGTWGTGYREIHTTGGEFAPAFVGIALEADARIMAAGLDMLEALEKAVWELVEIDNAAPGPVTIGPEQRADLATAINAARAAIFKARGKEPAT